jgi:hypothetical protein
MIEQFSLQTVLTYLTLISVPIGVFYHIMTLRNQSRTRQAQLFMSVYNNHISIPTATIWMEMIWEWNWINFEDFREKYTYPNNMEAHIKFAHYFASLEGLGVLCKKGLIDPNLVYDSHQISIILIWEKFLPIIEEFRLRFNTPQLYEDPEYLYNEMIRIRADRGHQPAQISPELKT